MGIHRNGAFRARLVLRRVSYPDIASGEDAFIQQYIRDVHGGSIIPNRGCRVVGIARFDSMHEEVGASGVVFTAIGMITPDPASVESVLTCASRLQRRVD